MSKNTLSSRRYFLQSAGAAGTALVGGLNTGTALADDCDFSTLPADFVYLNSGTEGSMPDCVITTLRNALTKWANDPTTSYETDPVLGKHQELNRSKVAEFLGVKTNNICLTDNTTMGLGMTLMGLNFRPNDRVVMTNHEHTAIRSPLNVLRDRIGLRIETRSFPSAATLGRISETELLDALFPDSPALRGAKALCVSHVYPTTGVRLPLRALRKKADELDIRYLIVDGAQALGMVDLTRYDDCIDNSDFYACPGHKWLNGPPSTGVLYVRNADIRPPEFYPTISQRMEKYADCGNETQSCFPVTTALQVRGCSNAPGFEAMITAINFAQRAGGPQQVEKHILALSQEVKKILLSQAPHCVVSPHSDAALSSGLTTFFPFKWDQPQQFYRDKKTADWVVKELLKKNIQVRSIGFRDAGSTDPATNEMYVIRVSTAYLNTSDDIARFFAALQSVLLRVG